MAVNKVGISSADIEISGRGLSMLLALDGKSVVKTDASLCVLSILRSSCLPFKLFPNNHFADLEQLPSVSCQSM